MGDRGIFPYDEVGIPGKTGISAKGLKDQGSLYDLFPVIDRISDIGEEAGQPLYIGRDTAYIKRDEIPESEGNRIYAWLYKDRDNRCIARGLWISYGP